MKIDNFKEILDKIENYSSTHPSYWGCALAGEVGEACNLIKKHERDNKDIKKELSFELADCFNYLVLIAKFYDINLEAAIFEKLEILKERRNKIKE